MVCHFLHLGIFLLLIYLMSFKLFNQPKELRRKEGNFPLPNNSKRTEPKITLLGALSATSFFPESQVLRIKTALSSKAKGNRLSLKSYIVQSILLDNNNSDSSIC